VIDTKQLGKLSAEAQYDIIKARTSVARRALELAKDEPEEVKSALREFAAHAEEQLEQASWRLR
jgi:hypothetical protein